jgi:hypothetical protein
MISRKGHIVDEGALGVTSLFQKIGDHAVIDHVADRDEEILVALGYKQEFKRSAITSHASQALLLMNTGTSLSGPLFRYHSPSLGFFHRLRPLWPTI